jgi:hypothetical protein
MTGLLNALWRIAFEPLYRRLFGRHFVGMTERLDTLSGSLDSHISGINQRQGAVNAEVIERLVELNRRIDELDRHVRTVAAAHWDTVAMARRMAALEDRLGEPESRDRLDSSAGADPRHDSERPPPDRARSPR